MPPRRDPNRKPPFGASVNWDHKLARGLEFCALFNERTGGLAIEQRSQRAGTLTNAPTWTAQADGGIDFATTGYVSWPSFSDTPFLGPLTVLWRGIVKDHSDYRTFAFKGNSNGATQCPFSFWIEPFTPRVTFARSNNVDTREWIIGAPSPGTLHQFAVTTPAAEINTAPTIYIDANGTVATTIFGGGTGAPTGTGSAIRIGRRADNLQQMIGMCSMALVFSVEKTADEIAAFWVDPWDFLLQPTRRPSRIALPLPPGSPPIVATRAVRASRN